MELTYDKSIKFVSAISPAQYINSSYIIIAPLEISKNDMQNANVHNELYNNNVLYVGKNRIAGGLGFYDDVTGEYGFYDDVTGEYNSYTALNFVTNSSYIAYTYNMVYGYISYYLEPAYTKKYGTVKTSSDDIYYDNYAKIGFNCSGQIIVPNASMTNFGTVKLVNDDIYNGNNYAYIKNNNKYQIIVPESTDSQYGAVKLSTYNLYNTYAVIGKNTYGQIVVPIASSESYGSVKIHSNNIYTEQSFSYIYNNAYGESVIPIAGASSYGVVKISDDIICNENYANIQHNTRQQIVVPSASTEEYGSVKLSYTGKINTSYARIGYNDVGQIVSPIASDIEYGSVKLSYNEQEIYNYARIGKNCSGQIVVPIASTNDFGAVKFGDSNKLNNNYTYVSLNNNNELAIKYADYNTYGVIKPSEININSTDSVSYKISVNNGEFNVDYNKLPKITELYFISTTMNSVNVGNTYTHLKLQYKINDTSLIDNNTTLNISIKNIHTTGNDSFQFIGNNILTKLSDDSSSNKLYFGTWDGFDPQTKKCVKIICTLSNTNGVTQYEDEFEIVNDIITYDSEYGQNLRINFCNNVQLNDLEYVDLGRSFLSESNNTNYTGYIPNISMYNNSYYTSFEPIFNGSVDTGFYIKTTSGSGINTKYSYYYGDSNEVYLPFRWKVNLIEK